MASGGQLVNLKLIQIHSATIDLNIVIGIKYIMNTMLMYLNNCVVIQILAWSCLKDISSFTSTC